MPEIASLVLCRSVVVDVFTGLWSYMMVVDNTLPIGTAEPENVSALPGSVPIEERRYLIDDIIICAIYLKSVDEVNAGDTEYEQRIIGIAPDEKEFKFEGIIRFKMAEVFHRTIHHTGIIGARIPGIYRIKLQFRRVGTEEWTGEASTFFLLQIPLEQNEEQNTEQDSPDPAA